MAPSSSGLGHHPLKVETRVRIPLGLLALGLLALGLLALGLLALGLLALGLLALGLLAYPNDVPRAFGVAFTCHRSD